jgi:hypothetical protein
MARVRRTPVNAPPVWTTIPFTPSKEISEVDPQQLPKEVVQRESLPSKFQDDENGARLGLLALAITLMGMVIGGIVFVGHPYVKNLDDVKKLFEAPVSLVTMLIGSAIGYYFGGKR